MFDLACRARVLVCVLPLLVACDQKGADPDQGTTDATSATTAPDSSATTATVEDTSATTSTPDTSVTSEDDSSATVAPSDATVTSEPSDTSAPEDSVAPPDDTTSPPDDVVVAEPTTYSLHMGGWTMTPSQEDTWCTVVRLGNPTPILINRIRTTLSQGSHHLIVYRSADTEEKTTPFKCTPFQETLGGSTIPVVITQIRDDQVQLPPDVVYEFAANQMIRLESHYLNYYPEDITTSIDVHFDTVAETANTQRADILFYGNIAIYLLKDQIATLPWKFLSVPSGLTIFAMTGHTHQLGTNVEVEKTTAQSTPGESVYPPEGEAFLWSEAPIALFDPEMHFGANEGFRFRCSYNNTSGGTVTFGESAKKEMCFFWAYYYPSQGPIIRF